MILPSNIILEIADWYYDDYVADQMERYNSMPPTFQKDVQHNKALEQALSFDRTDVKAYVTHQLDRKEFIRRMIECNRFSTLLQADIIGFCDIARDKYLDDWWESHNKSLDK